MHLSAMPGMPNMSWAEMTPVFAQPAPAPAQTSAPASKPAATQAPGVGENLDVSA